MSKRQLEDRIRGALAIRRLEFVSMDRGIDHKGSYTDTFVLLFRAEPAHYWTLAMEEPIPRERSDYDELFFASAVEKIRDWKRPNRVVVVAPVPQSHQLFVLVRIYADGSRLLFGPAVKLEEALMCRRWWNYFDGEVDAVSTHEGDDYRIVAKPGKRHYKIAPWVGLLR